MAEGAEDGELKPLTQGSDVADLPEDDALESPSKRAAKKSRLAELKREWDDFPNLPGKHFSVRRANRGLSRLLGTRPTRELVDDSNGAVVATGRYKAVTFKRIPHVVTFQGRTLKWRRVSRHVYDLIGVATNAPVLRRSGVHFAGQATSQVTLGSQVKFDFPVRGKLMSAIDESGDSLIQYRLDWIKDHLSQITHRIDIVISPRAPAIPHIELVAAVSWSWLLSYHEKAGGG